MLLSSRAIVLRVIKHTDDTLLAHLLTEDYGRQTVAVRISRSRRAVVPHTLFQPAALVQVMWNKGREGSVVHPKAAQTIYIYTSLPYDPEKSAIAMFLCEVLDGCVRAESDAHALFRYVSGSFQWLDCAEMGFANFHLTFLMRLTRFLGFMPNLSGYAPGSWFDLRAAGYMPSRPLHSDCLPPEEAALLPMLQRMNFANMRLFRMTGAQRSRILQVISLYYRLHMPSFPELKTLDVLGQLYY